MTKVHFFIWTLISFSGSPASAKIDQDIVDHDEAKELFESIKGDTFIVDFSTLENTAKKYRKIVSKTIASEEGVIRPLSIKYRENSEYRCEENKYWIGYKEIGFAFGELGLIHNLTSTNYRCFYRGN